MNEYVIYQDFIIKSLLSLNNCSIYMLITYISIKNLSDSLFYFYEPN